MDLYCANKAPTHLHLFLGANPNAMWRGKFSRRDVCRFYGWGTKPSGRRAELFASGLHGSEFVLLEDGFLRSYAAGSHFPSLSLIQDKVGIYYDSTRPSDLENLLNSDVDLLDGICGDVAQAKDKILTLRLSKYNDGRDLKDGEVRDTDQCRVLVVDQTKNDQAVIQGGADEKTFQIMLDAALAENPTATIYIKTHPETSSGAKAGYLTEVASHERVVLLRDHVNPHSVFDVMDRVYVVTSHIGFEAMLAGKPVTVFGRPWYGGWGVSDDRQRFPRRKRYRSVDELFAAGYFHYTQYVDPITHKLGSIFDVIDWLALQKRVARKVLPVEDEGKVICIGFSRWKAKNVEPFFLPSENEIHFVESVDAAKQLGVNKGDFVVCWGRSSSDELRKLVRRCNAKLVCMEDGFIRSLGLGSDLIPPLSIVLDHGGLYIDPSTESDLENILNFNSCDEELLARSANLAKNIRQNRITKYNLEDHQPPDWKGNARRIILVPGQVEDDASILLGSNGIRASVDLLESVRKQNPDAFIVFKPHPDVLAGNRKGISIGEQVEEYVDHIEVGSSIISCIEACDEVHTLTSLSGFDALLWRKKVVTYGQPFYAGWGLTIDRCMSDEVQRRRSRTLSVDALIAGALIEYPIYWDSVLCGYSTPERIVAKISDERQALEQAGQLQSIQRNRWQRKLFKLNQILQSYIG